MQQLSTITFPCDFSEFSEIIDVRSPSEYALDHIPGSINLPVLNDEQRVKVGTLYKQNTFEARRLGAALISANVSEHIQNNMMQHGLDYRPALYCWRGGMRSRSFTFILQSIGWKPHVISGGYRAFRKFIVDDTDEIFLKDNLNLQVLSGLTGVGKTRLLKSIKEQGAQILDLEGLANHKGSLLGATPSSKQPAQKKFETQLWHQMKQFDLTKPIFTEAESNRIGNIHCPPALWKALKRSRVINVKLPIAERIKILLEEYPHFTENTDKLKLLLSKLIPLRGHKQVEQWNTLIDTKQWNDFVQSVLETHYDLCYRSPGEVDSNYLKSTGEITIADASKESFTHAAKQAIMLSP
ncbi:MAG: tRNA 2-selenouridine(34) synthase MnmH [Akkermansiaceae bacterium]